MNLEELIAVTGAFLVVLIPVAGLTARFALKPLIETVAKVMQARQGNEALQLAERRLAVLEQEMALMRTELQQIGESKEFYRRLAESSSIVETPARDG